jgi:tetratricopeptide (TPR) repeat protein
MIEEERNHSSSLVSNLLQRINVSRYTVTSSIGYSIIIFGTLAAAATTSGSSGLFPAALGVFAAGFWDEVGGPLFELLRRGRQGRGQDEDDNEAFVKLFAEFERHVQMLDHASLDRFNQLSTQLENQTRLIGTCLELQKNAINDTVYRSTQILLDEMRATRTLQPQETAIESAGEDELLIIVATFRGQRSNDASMVLAEQITQILRKARVRRIRVESTQQVLGPDDDGLALGLLLKFSASLVIWGRDTTSGVAISHLRRVHLEGLYVTQQTLLNPKTPEFFVEMNYEIPALLTCGALVAVSDTLAHEGRFKDVVELTSKIVQIVGKGSSLKNDARQILSSAYSNMGFSYWATGQYRKAIEAYTAVIEMDQALGTISGLPYMNRAVNQNRMGNHLMARSDFGAAEQLIDTFSDGAASLYFNIAVSYSDHGDIERAITYYLKADEATESGIHSAAVHNLGILLLKHGRVLQAIEQFTRVIEAEPDHPHAYTNRASAWVALERYQEAIADCTVSIDKGTDEPSAYLNRSKARLYMHLKQPGSMDVQAIEYDLDAAIERQKITTPDDLFWYGLCFRAIGRNQRACEYFRRYVQTAPSGKKKEEARTALREMNCG